MKQDQNRVWRGEGEIGVGEGFTARALADALGVSKRRVHVMLNGVAPDLNRPGNGGLVRCWRWATLPETIRGRLLERGFQPEAAIAASAWQPALPLVDCSDDDKNAAVKLRCALRLCLEKRNDTAMTVVELESLGVRDYRLEFGSSITPATWRKLFNRTLVRDGGRENWDRLEIYLPDIPQKRIAEKAASHEGAWGDLNEVVGALRDPMKLSQDEESYLWACVFENFERLEKMATNPRAVKAEIVRFLAAQVPFISASEDGVRKQFERKFARWVSGGRRPCAVDDRRGMRAQPAICDEDAEKLLARTVLQTGGRLAQAWRELGEAGEFSQETQDRYFAKPHPKSYVPQGVRDKVGPEALRLEPIHHGPRRAKLNGAHVNRDWSSEHSFDWYQADDCTLPVYYYRDDGRGWFMLERGQFLPMIDVRSTCILGSVFIQAPTYNSMAIRTLITKVCDEYGLPRRGFYFENGIWRSSRILAGDKSARAQTTAEAERGLRDLGLEFRHAKLPRAKPVERVLGALQNYMEGFPGYAGRDERHDEQERFQRLKRSVESRKLDPREFLFDARGWEAKIHNLCIKYNGEVQEGKMCPGLSPDQALEKFQNLDDPRSKLDARCRYLLAYHRRPMRVTANGITLPKSFGGHTYRNTETGRMVGQDVLVWFNPEIPHAICVTDMDRENPVVVEIDLPIPAMSSSAEELSQAQKRIHDHQAYAVARYSVIKAKFSPKFRHNVVDADSAQLGRELNAREAEAADSRLKTRTAEKRLAAISGRLGIVQPRATALDPERLAALEGVADFLKENETV